MEIKESKKTVATFAAASFLNDLGSDLIYPIWPLYLTSVLGANMAVLGFIDGLGDALVSISQAVSGYISDKIKKRKIFIWLGYFCGALSRIGYGLSNTWHYIVPFRILDRAGKVRAAPRDAIIADVSTDENRGKNFGILRAMDNLGAVCGILLCIILFPKLGYKPLFYLAALPTLIGILLILLLVKERRAESIKIYKGLKLKDLNFNFILFLLVSAIFALGSFSYSFLLIFAKKFQFTQSGIPVLYLIFTLVASLFSIPFGKLADKIGRKGVLILSYLFWAIVCISFIVAPIFSIPTYFWIIFSFICYGLHKGAIEPAQRAFVSELAPEEFRASALGGFQMIIGICALPASFIAGLLWEKVSIYSPFYFSFALTFISAVMLNFVKRPNPKN